MILNIILKKSINLALFLLKKSNIIKIFLWIKSKIKYVL